ncbi:MAG: hypothetical protein ACYCVY_12085 [Acidiferrobacteraceae bacterium]
MQPKRLTARCAQHLDAILAARKRGITWGELAPLLGACSAGAVRKAFERAQRGVERALYCPEQMPLPESESAQTATAQSPATVTSPTANGDLATRFSIKRFIKEP